MQKVLTLMVITLALASLGGCGTIMDLGGGDGSGPRIYGGVRLDGDAVAGSVRIGRHEHPAWCGAIDMPFALVFDTLALPYTLIRTLLVGEGRYHPLHNSKEE